MKQWVHEMTSSDIMQKSRKKHPLALLCHIFNMSVNCCNRVCLWQKINHNGSPLTDSYTLLMFPDSLWLRWTFAAEAKHFTGSHIFADISWRSDLLAHIIKTAGVTCSSATSCPVTTVGRVTDWTPRSDTEAQNKHARRKSPQHRGDVADAHQRTDRAQRRFTAGRQKSFIRPNINLVLQHVHDFNVTVQIACVSLIQI